MRFAKVNNSGNERMDERVRTTSEDMLGADSKIGGELEAKQCPD